MILSPVSVTKEITFDCAHMLSGHKGKCANLHGHTYKCQVCVQGYARAYPSDESESSMVIDFGDLKEIMQKTIMERFDHALIFSDLEHRNTAEMELWDWATCFNMKYYEMPGRTTSEIMAMHIRDLVRAEITSRGIEVGDVHVRLWETPTSFAEA